MFLEPAREVRDREIESGSGEQSGAVPQPDLRIDVTGAETFDRSQPPRKILALCFERRSKHGLHSIEVLVLDTKSARRVRCRGERRIDRRDSTEGETPPKARRQCRQRSRPNGPRPCFSTRLSSCGVQSRMNPRGRAMAGGLFVPARGRNDCAVLGVSYLTVVFRSIDRPHAELG